MTFVNVAELGKFFRKVIESFFCGRLTLQRPVIEKMVESCPCFGLDVDFVIVFDFFFSFLSILTC